MSSAAVVIGALRVNQYQKSFLKNAEFKFAAFFSFFSFRFCTMYSVMTSCFLTSFGNQTHDEFLLGVTIYVFID